MLERTELKVKAEGMYVDLECLPYSSKCFKDRTSVSAWKVIVTLLRTGLVFVLVTVNPHKGRSIHANPPSASRYDLRDESLELKC